MRIKLIDLIDPKLYNRMNGDVHDEWERYVLSEYKDQFKLNEGLILTHPLSKALNVLDKSGFDVVEPRKENVFHVVVYRSKTDIDKLLKITNNLGWFPSAVGEDIVRNFDKYTASNLRSKMNSFDKVFIRFEAKYDIQLGTEGIDYLYHFTKKIFLGRIEKYGLTPKTASKLSNHPERIYLSFSANGAAKFGKKFINRIFNPKRSKKYSDDVIKLYKTGIILRIRVESIPFYFKIYEDPNYKGTGCFTLNNIPWNSIDVFDEFNLD